MYEAAFVVVTGDFDEFPTLFESEEQLHQYMKKHFPNSQYVWRKVPTE